MFESAVLQLAQGQRARSAVVFPLAVLTHVIVLGSVLAVQLLAVDEVPVQMPVIFDAWPREHSLPAEGPGRPPSSGARTPAQHDQVVQPSSVPAAVPAPADHAEPAIGQGVPGGVGEPGPGGGDGAGDAAAPVELAIPPEPPAILNIGGEVLAPVIVARVMPIYPPIARTAGKQGAVRVRAVIDIDGNVVDAVVVHDDVGFGCGEAAVTAIRQWRFRPASMRGRPVSVFMEITVAFTLSRG